MTMGAPLRPSPALRCVFRIAAGPRVGFGHLMRARALARALGVRPVVSLRGGKTARQAAERAGCEVLPPESDPCAAAALLIVDDPSPEHTQRWVARARRQQLLTVSIHDGGVGHSDADLVVDGSASCPPSSRGRRRLVGPRFYLLEPNAGVGRRTRAGRGASRVLVALGGGAHVRRVAPRLVAALAARCPTADIVVAAGLVSGRLPAMSGGRWLASPSGLTQALVASDVVVVAGGVTLYEACALGRPAVGMAVVEAQRPAITALARQGGILDAGGPNVDAATAARVGGAVAALVADSTRRRRLSRAARRLVDGRGATRVARHIQTLLARSRARA